MWPFKKKEKTINVPGVRSVLCVPCFINDTTEIVAKTNGKYMVIGDILMDVFGKKHYIFELCDRDLRMKRSFEVAGKVTGVSNEFITEIDKHTAVIYINSETGNFKEAYSLANIGTMILEIGGLGIKVESTGKAFNKDSWIELTKEDNIGNLYEMYVIESIINNSGHVYSCGMHNLGYPDTIVFGEDFLDATKIIRIFNFYQLVDKPVILDGQTFQTSVDSPFYRIHKIIDQPNRGQDLFENPFGMWGLARIN
jgi:hypothetical protein